MKGQSYIILAIIFALLVAVFAVINVDAVQVNYLFGSGEAPLILVILISVLMGGVITASVGALRYFRLKRDYKNLEKKVEEGPSPEPKSTEPKVTEPRAAEPASATDKKPEEEDTGRRTVE